MTLGTSTHIKAGQGNAVEGKVFQEQAKETETLPLPLLGVLKKSPNFTTIKYMQRNLAEIHEAL